MRFDIITIFPELFGALLDCGILRRARRGGILEVRLVDLRDFATDKHRSVDDRPFGGGEGMVLMPGPLFAATIPEARRAVLPDRRAVAPPRIPPPPRPGLPSVQVPEPQHRTTQAVPMLYRAA